LQKVIDENEARINVPHILSASDWFDKYVKKSAAPPSIDTRPASASMLSSPLPPRSVSLPPPPTMTSYRANPSYFGVQLPRNPS
jgi:hypothetical protein